MNDLVQPGEILAYIDPGTLSMILQVIIGAVFAILVSVKIFWHSIKNLFKRLFPKKKREQTEKDKAFCSSEVH